MRLKAILSFVFIATLISIFSLFFLDDMIKNLIIKNGQEANGAKIEISTSKLSLSPFGIQLGGIKIANKEKPMENLVEFNTVAMHINIGELINKKFVVENVVVTGLKTNTARKKSGQLPKTVEKTTKIESGSSVEPEPSAKVPPSEIKRNETDSEINIYDYVDKDSLSVSTEANKIKADINKTSKATLKEISQTKELEDALSRVKSELSSLKTIKIDSLSDLSKLKDSLENIKALENEIKTIQAEIERRKSLVATQTTNYKKQMNSLTTASKNDYSKIVSTVDFRQFNSSSFTNTLLKGPIEQQVGQYLGYFEKVMMVMNKIQENKKDEDTVNKQTVGGITVPLVDKSPVPSVWVKTITISGVSNGMPVSIHIKDVSSDQSKLNKTTVMNIEVIRSKSTKILVAAEFDFRSLPGTAIVSMSFNDLGLSTEVVKSTKLDSKGEMTITGTRINGNVKITAKELKLKKNVVNNAFVSAILGTIRNTSMTIFLNGSFNSPSISLTSDLDDLLNKAFKNQAKKEEGRIKKQIKDQLDSVVSAQNDAVNGALGTYNSKASNAISGQEKQVDIVKKDIEAKKAVIESKKKEVETDIKAEKEKQQKQLAAQKKAEAAKLKAELEKAKNEAKKQLESQFKKLF
jgi:uncharacterized protein (TIGR03545 family)